MKSSKINVYKIAGGNATSLVEGCLLAKRNVFAKSELRFVEQVGFIEEVKIPTMTMMGGELSINGSLAFAKHLGQKSGILKTSGSNQIVTFKSTAGLTAGTFILQPKIIKDRQIVLFEGIGYICIENSTTPTRESLRVLASEFNLPAFGVAGFIDNKLTPFVYVKDTDSLVAETACGSGSVALSIITGQETIIQPTGQNINVVRNGDRFTVCAKVAKMKL